MAVQVLGMKNLHEVEYEGFMDRLSTLPVDLPEMFEGQSSVRFAPTHLNEVLPTSTPKRDTTHLNDVLPT